MKFRFGAAAFLVLALLFLIANRASYKSWFNDDDLDNIVWTYHAQPKVFITGLVDPLFAEFNFRPVGHLYYHLLSRTVGVNFRWYMVLLHLFHLLNVWMVWKLVRRLDAPLPAAIAGTLFFAFHMACFDAYWKPMFVFDVLCATFSLLTLLLYLSGAWLWALIPFVLAYKAKELAVALPVVVLLHEFLVGERRWKRTLPFFAIAVSFAIQGVLANRAVDNDYSLRFTTDALLKTSQFYLSEVLLAPYLGFALLALLFVPGKPRLRLAIVSFFVLIGPLWFLPGRLFSVYLYVPLIALAVGVAVITEKLHWRWVALLIAFWLPVNYAILRQKRAVALNIGTENKAWFEAAGGFMRANPELKRVIYDGHPLHLAQWGVVATCRWFRWDADFELIDYADPRAQAAIRESGTGIISWDRGSRRLLTGVKTDQVGISWIDFSKDAPVWLLEKGWFGLETHFRWTEPRATVRLRRPDDVREFVLFLNLGPGQLEVMGGVAPEVLIDGLSLGKKYAGTQGWQQLHYRLQPGPAGPVEVELAVDPPFIPGGGDPRKLGVAVLALGFR